MRFYPPSEGSVSFGNRNVEEIHLDEWRQRIASARAVLLDPAYLLLDEVTCNMDIYAERQVTEALFRLMKGRTTVMISHDMRMLARADQVVVLKDGIVEAALPKDEAIKTSPTLQALIRANTGGIVA